MTNEDIRKERDLMYENIKESNERLLELRALCPHEDKVEVNYSFRIGQMSPATVCDNCGELID